MWYWLVPYFIIAMATARVVCIWLDGDDDGGNPIAVAFVCGFIGMVWPAVWLVRFITKGFSNPMRPW